MRPWWSPRFALSRVRRLRCALRGRHGLDDVRTELDWAGRWVESRICNRCGWREYRPYRGRRR
jgi:hypothetical protein